MAHTYTANTCFNLTCMLEDQGDFKTTANAADAPPNSNISQADTDIRKISDATGSSDVTSILASAFNLMVNYPEEKDAFTEDMMALNQT